MVDESRGSHDNHRGGAPVKKRCDLMLTKASLRYYAATNALVVLGVAVAVAVLAGALLVGGSVRESLKQIALGRLGNTDVIVNSPTFFRTALSDDILKNRGPEAGNSVAPLIVAGGAVSHDESKRSAGRVMVYGVDERFFNFHSRHPAPSRLGREALVSDALAAELGAQAGDSITPRVAKPTDIPLSSLQGRRESDRPADPPDDRAVLDESHARRVLALAVAGSGALDLRSARSPAARPRLGDRVNTLLMLSARKAIPTIKRSPPAGGDARRSRTAHARRAQRSRHRRSARRPAHRRARRPACGRRRRRRLGRDAGTDLCRQHHPRGRSRECPIRWSPRSSCRSRPGYIGRPPIWLNQWAADDLSAKPGDAVTLDYFLWSDESGLTTASATFHVRRRAADERHRRRPTLTPDYPGISDAADITAWDPPFPVDLKRIRKQDEEYWEQYRGRPQGDHHGQRRAAALGIALRQSVVAAALRVAHPIAARAIDPAAAGFTVAPFAPKRRGRTGHNRLRRVLSLLQLLPRRLGAAAGLSVLRRRASSSARPRSACCGGGLLASEDSRRLRARRRDPRRRSAPSSAHRRHWLQRADPLRPAHLVDRRRRHHRSGRCTSSRSALAAGVIGTFAVGRAALWLGVRAMSRRSARSLLKGERGARSTRSTIRDQGGGVLLLITGTALLGAPMSGAVDATAGFFGAGGAWLVGGLCAASIYLRRRRSSTPAGPRPVGIVHAGRPAHIRAAGTIGAEPRLDRICQLRAGQRRRVQERRRGVRHGPRSGTGGYALMAESSRR